MNPHRLRGVALAATALSLIAFSTTPASAQLPVGKDPVPSILNWTQKQQLERYPAIEKTYRVTTIRKGDKVREIPVAATQMNPRVTYNKRTSSVDDFMKAQRVTGLIAIKDGRIVLEKYALGRKPEDRWTSFSVAKSMTATLIGAAIRDKYIRSVYDPITRYIPELEGSVYDGVSLWQLMTMTSGVKWNEDYADPRSDVARAGQTAYDGKVNPLVAYAKTMKRETSPGTKFVYKTIDTDLAGIVLSRALAGKNLAQYASEKIWAPYGMEQDAIWMVDKAGHERGGCCMSMTLRDYARIGLFALGGGTIDGKQVLADDWIAQSTQNALPKALRDKGETYGYFWWQGEPPNYRAVGIFGQGIFVYPEENLVIAINSAATKASDRALGQARNALIEAVRKAANQTATAAN